MTALVRDWYTLARDNHGLAVADDETRSSGHQRSVFSDSTATNPDDRPYLELEYFVPCPSDPYAAAQSSSASTVYALERGAAQGDARGRSADQALACRAMMHVGIFDALNSVYFAKLEALSTGDPTASQSCGWESYHTLAETAATTDADLAAGFAAKEILTSLFPARTTDIATAFTTIHGSGPYQAAAQSLGHFVATGCSPTAPVTGRGADVVHARGRAGLVAADAQPLGGRPVRERQRHGTPTWGSVTPFTMSSAGQFRPPYPRGRPRTRACSTHAYTAQFEEVKELGAVTSSTRGSDRTYAAWFWANTWTAPTSRPGSCSSTPRRWR